MRLPFFLVIIVLGTAFLLKANENDFHEPREQLTSEGNIVDAANRFIALLSDEQQEKSLFPFETDERTFWNFVPMTGQRKGLPLKSLNDEQRIAVHNLLQTTLSTQGYLKVTMIQQLERLLGEIENRPDYRDPGFYYLTFFGTPSLENAWGWRFEGHHLSLNFSMIEGELAVTPTFLGTNPGQVRSTLYSGLEVLHQEISLARQLMGLFTSEQRQLAMIATTAPREIITGNSRVAVLEQFEGISYQAMTGPQQKLMHQLLAEYANNLNPDIAIAQLSKIEEAGFDSIYFAWAGSLTPTAAHYFRIHGPTTLIEYDNTQNNANHVHTVWRDLENDFGRDLLRHHYEQSDHEH